MSELDCGYRNWGGGSRIPSGLMEWYQNLRVRLHNGNCTRVSIHRYRNLNMEDPDHSAMPGFTEGKSQVFRPLRQRASRIHGTDSYRAEYTDNTGQAIGSEEFDLSRLARVFAGWGDPIEIGQVLRLAVWCGAIAPVTALQSFCDRFIGLDCSGFCGNYYGGRLRGCRPSEYLAFQEIRSLDRVRQGNAIVWHGGAVDHVAAIDFVDPLGAAASPLQRVRCWVAESTGSQLGPDFDSRGGLTYSDYVLTQETGSVAVHRPTRTHRECEEGNYARSANATVHEVP